MIRATSLATQLLMCVLVLKTSHRPDGKMADVLASTPASAADAPVNYRMYVPQRPSMFPIAPMGFSHILRVCLQGGGVFVNSGTVTFSLCTITGNTAYYVRAHTQNFPCPRWKFLADMQVDSRRSIGIKSCFTRDMCVLMLKISHRHDDGIFTCFALVLAGRRCLHLKWHGDLLIVHHQWEHS